MKKVISIDSRKIGEGYPPYIIAEISANHNGEIDKAFKIIDIAKKAKADAVKMQTYTPDTLTIDCDHPDFRINEGLWNGRALYDLYKEAFTPYEWHKPIFEYAKKVNITLFSTPFDETAVDLLEDLSVPAYKIASFEAVDLPLIKYVAQTRKPMIISTGMANEEEIGEAVQVARENGCSDLVLLHCISSYPAPVEQCHLSTIPDLAKRFDVISGLSDHTLGTTVAIASVALGAQVIEKHVTLSRADKGPDSEFSLEPDELRKLCSESKQAWLSVGKVNYERKASEESSIKFRRSIYVVKNVKKGELFTKENIRRIRPGLGLSPKYFDDILGQHAACDISFGTALKLEYIENKINK